MLLFSAPPPPPPPPLPHDRLAPASGLVLDSVLALTRRTRRLYIDVDRLAVALPFVSLRFLAS